MRKLLFVIVLGALCIPLYTFTQVKQIKRKPDGNLEMIQTVLPVDQSTFMKTVIKLFREKKSGPPTKFSRFSLSQVGEENFPADYQLAHYKEESINRYLAIAPDRRKLDFYLYDFSDADDRQSYWASEYYVGAEPAPFRCNFLIHHEPEDSARTKVEIFEFTPRVWVGEKFTVDRHGPGRRLDIRTVSPTTSDRVELLDVLKAAVR
jgi:hypothetical protein